MRRLAWIVPLLLSGCGFDSAGHATFPDEEETSNNADTTIEETSAPDTFVDDSIAVDSVIADTFVADTFVADTFVADTFKPDTFVPDTFVPDTFVPDTFVADTAPADTTPTCTEANSGIYNGHCYFLVDKGVSWTTARDACISAKAHLATITTAGEWTFVNGLPGGGSYGRWIGLSAAAASDMRSAFQWITAEAFSYDKWMASHPDKSGTCVVMHSPSFTPSGGWEDVPCTSSYLYICERD